MTWFCVLHITIHRSSATNLMEGRSVLSSSLPPTWSEWIIVYHNCFKKSNINYFCSVLQRAFLCTSKPVTKAFDRLLTLPWTRISKPCHRTHAVHKWTTVVFKVASNDTSYVSCCKPFIIWNLTLRIIATSHWASEICRTSIVPIFSLAWTHSWSTSSNTTIKSSSPLRPTVVIRILSNSKRLF